MQVKPTKPDHKKVTRFAIWGAIALGLTGFLSGLTICLYYKLPIPPLFISELGVIVGGCLGALCALTGTEKRVLPTFVSILFTVPLCIFAGVGLKMALVGVVAVAIAVWSLADGAPADERAWKNI